MKTLHQKLFFLLILLLPTQLGLHFWPEWSTIFGIRVDYLSPTIFLTDVLMAAIILLWVLAEHPRFKINKLYLILIVYLFATSLFIAQNQEVAIYKLIKIVELFLLGFYVYKTKVSANTIKTPLSVALLYSSLFAWVQFLSGKTLGGIFWWLGERTFDASTPGIALATIGGQDFLRPYATFPHPNVLAGFLLAGIILMLGVKKQAIYTKGIFLLSVATTIITFSQGAWITGVFLLIFYKIFNFEKDFRKIFKTVFLLSVSISFFLLVTSKPVEKYFVSRDVLQRLDLNIVAAKIFSDFPITGAGLNNFIVNLPNYGASDISWWLQPVHNIFLLVLVETGVVGFSLFVLILFPLLKKASLSYTPYAMCLLAILITGVVDHYWLTLQQGELLTTIILGLIAAKARNW